MGLKELQVFLEKHAHYKYYLLCDMFSSVQSLSHVRLFETPWTAAHEASLSFTIAQSLLKLMSIESVMPFNQLALCDGPYSVCGVCFALNLNKSVSYLSLCLSLNSFCDETSRT